MDSEKGMRISRKSKHIYILVMQRFRGAYNEKALHDHFIP